MSFNVDQSKHSEIKNPRVQRKRMHKVYLYSMSTPFYALSTILYFYIGCIFSLRHLEMYTLLSILKILSRIQSPSPRQRCGSAISPLLAPSRFLTTPKLESKSRYPPRKGDLCSHRDDLESAFLHQSFPSRRPTIRPPHDTRCQLADELNVLYPETLKTFHC